MVFVERGLRQALVTVRVSKGFKLGCRLCPPGIGVGVVGRVALVIVERVSLVISLC